MKPYLKYACVIMISLVLLSCGGDNLGHDNVTVPEGGSVTFLTEEISLSYPATTDTAELFPNERIVIKAADASGFPVANALIIVSYPFAAPASFSFVGCPWGANNYGNTTPLTSTQVIMQFFDHNGVRQNQPLIVKTNEYGVAEFSADFILGCVGFAPDGISGISHSGQVSAQSGGNSDTMDLSVGPG